MTLRSVALACVAMSALSACGPTLDADAASTQGILVGAASGLAVSGTGLSIEFGRTEESAVQVLSRLLGAAPSSTVTRGDCGEPAVNVATWEEGLQAVFSSGDFRGWRATAAGFTTVQGLEIGGRQEDVTARGGGIRPGFGGDRLTLNGVNGQLSEAGSITALWAGRTCRTL